LNRWNRAIEGSLEELLKDREALAVRNMTLAEAYHQRPLRHRLRHLLLQLFSSVHIPPSSHIPETERILLIRPDHIGDVLLTTPAMRALRDHYPNAEIHALVNPISAAVLKDLSAIDLVLTLSFPGFTRTKATNLRVPYSFAIQTARRLRKVGYTQAIIFRPDHWWGAWLAYMAGIPVRVGYAQEDTAPFLTQSLPPQHDHIVTQSLRLVALLTGQPLDPEQSTYHFPLTAPDRAYIDGYLEEWGLAKDDVLLCIHPGSGAKAKLWEVEKWAKTADILCEQLSARVVFTGSDSELPLIRKVIQHMEVSPVVVAGDTSLGQLGALYERASVVLGPDSGPMHLAAAVGTPTVTLYGPADPVEFGPWGDPRRHVVLTTDIACRPCRVLDWSSDDPRYHPCVRDITVTQVLSAARLVAAHGQS